MHKYVTKTGASKIYEGFKKVFLLTLVSVCLFLFSSVNSASAAVKYWIGPGGGNFTANSNWSTTSGGSNDTVAPTATDIATFDSGGNTNCTIDGAISVAGIDIKATYTLGTISQGSSTVAVGTSHFTQAGGTFTGGNVAITITGSFIISGGTFTSTSGVMTISLSFTKTGTPTFDANGGTVTFGGTYGGSTSIDASGVSFNLVTINRNFSGGYGSAYVITIVSGTTIPLGNNPTITLNNTPELYGGTYSLINNGTITMGTGTATFNINGTFTNNSSFSGDVTTLALNCNFTNNTTTTFASVTTITSVVFSTGAGNLINNGPLNFNNVSSFTLAGGITNNAGFTITTAATTFTIGGTLSNATGAIDH